MINPAKVASGSVVCRDGSKGIASGPGMPRSAAHKRKAKNTGVGIDFKRAKHKVGRKLPKAQNATDTNFKSRAITLPAQTVGDDKGSAVTKRNLSLKVSSCCLPSLKTHDGSS